MKQGLPFLLLGLLAARGLAADAGPEVVAVPAPLSMAAINAPLVVARIKAGELTPEQAWQQGQLKQDDLLFLLEQEGGDRGSLNLVDSSGLGLAFVELLIKHYPELVAKPEQLSANVRFRLAVYDKQQGDPRAAPLLEDLLQKAEVSKPQLPWYYAPAATLLGEFYQEAGQYQQALNTFLGAIAVSKRQAYVADWLVAAARISTRLGKPEQAQQLYAQVARCGEGWFTGVALYDQAVLMIAQGKHREARELLQRPVVDEQARIAQSSLLAFSYYQTGDFLKARQYSQEALKCFRSNVNLRQGLGLEAQSNAAQAILDWSEQWLQSPLICDPQEIRLPLDQTNRKTVITHLDIRSPYPVPLVVTTDNPMIQARLSNDKQKQLDNGFFSQREIIIEIAPKAMQEGLNAIVTIKNAEFIQVQVPIHIEAQSYIRTSLSCIYFGFVNAGQTTTKTLKLTASIPFRIVRVDIDNKAVQVQADIKKMDIEHSLDLKFLSLDKNKFYTGTIQIKTDMLGQKSIELPYAAHVN